MPSPSGARPRVMGGWPRSASTSRTPTSPGANRVGVRTYFEELAPQRRSLRPKRLAGHADISEQLQTGGRRCSASAILAATLSPSWGVCGPAFELLGTSQRPGSEGTGRRSTSCATGTSTADSAAPLPGRLNRIGASSRHWPTCARCASTTPRATPCSATRRPGRPTPDHRAGGGQPRCSTTSAWLVDVDLAALGCRTSPATRSRPAQDRRFSWRAWNFVDPTPRLAHIFRVEV
jgi:hypothetical protein